MYDNDYDPSHFGGPGGEGEELIWWCLAFAVIAGLLVGIFSFPSHGRPSEQWAQASPERQEFFKKAMRPDYLPRQAPCCGEADAYEADEFDTVDGELYAILTCNEPAEDGQCHEVPGRPPIPAGTRIHIPPEKLLPPPPDEPPNNTGHGWVFVSSNGSTVFCYVLPGGY